MDGTLLSSKSTILPEVSQAVHKLKANGNVPVICTGRAAFEVQHFMKEYQINSLIATNGQYGKFAGQIAFNLTIPSAICQKY